MKASIGFSKRLLWWGPATAMWLPELIGYFAPYVAPILLFLALCVAVRLFWPCHEQAIREEAIRWIGGGFQLAGVITIVLKLHAAHRQFPQQTLKLILERRPRFRVRSVAASFRGTSTSTVTVRAELRLAPGPPPTVEQRLAMLEDGYTKLAGEVGDLGKEMTREMDELSNKLKAEAAGREAADKRVEERLKETAIGGIHLDVWGVSFVMLGIAGGTASSEIAAWIGAACR